MTDLVTVAEAKAFLNITGSASDSQLASFITSASDMITNRVGPVVGSPTYDEWYDGGGSKIVLRHTPVQSVSLVTESWGANTIYTLSSTVLDGSGGPASAFSYSIDLAAGLLIRRASGTTVRFAPGDQNIHVQYVGGYATTPPELQLATKLLMQHLWASQRGGSRRPGLGADEAMSNSGDSDAFPARVEEILANFYIPGIA